MATYPYAEKVDPNRAIRDEVAARLERSIREWQEGRSTSPDERDYVIYTREILEKRLGDDFIGTTPEGEQFVADALNEIQSGGPDEQLVTWDALADWLVDNLVAE